jgi:uncharacterized membrane protein
MKNILLLLAGVLTLASCSSPKYAYHFDHYDYNSGKKQAVAKNEKPVSAIEQQSSPIVLQNQALTADATSTTPVMNTAKENNPVVNKKAITEKIASMSKAERKDLKSNLKKYIKAVKKNPDQGADVNATKEWDHDLKMAAIFGAIGVVLTALGGVNTIFWVIGVVALVIGLVFLIKWLARQ